MKERGILFSAPMVRAILDGRKTQTRRVMVPQPAALCRYEMNGAGTHALHLGPPRRPGETMSFVPPTPTSRDHRLPCPYGVPGDRMWVRETWSRDALTVYPCPPVWYRADVGSYDDPASGEHTRHCDALRTGHPRADCFACAGPFRWRPSIFMPRKLSRITLEIAEIRVQRLQEISEASARAEGVRVSDSATARQDAVDVHGMTPFRGAFACVWQEINGKRAPWASDPWVWAITFRRVER